MCAPQARCQLRFPCCQQSCSKELKQVRCEPRRKTCSKHAGIVSPSQLEFFYRGDVKCGISLLRVRYQPRPPCFRKGALKTGCELWYPCIHILQGSVFPASFYQSYSMYRGDVNCDPLYRGDDKCDPLCRGDVNCGFHAADRVALKLQGPHLHLHLHQSYLVYRGDVTCDIACPYYGI
ncbi:hypothetical protein BO78DRAFT_389133 [Aspergillus sclerotiicarbonarius CBS 121057]|uniref:Uncharacterized protein n=1 Tax=Aspergillus sclerotiicarbonarius (strain CBS 121057 / IBT 28362) TaxID=1448318 RepID=A0A319EIX2_ASPSB|nr:hypothetical protein BO78DRAFT_389133 [Aspergillus sclerotiicarbonarius CBS 121057]